MSDDQLARRPRASQARTCAATAGPKETEADAPALPAYGAARASTPVAS
jgi:hypothetical protein